MRLGDKLIRMTTALVSPPSTHPAPAAVLLFPGQGSQWAGMAAGLLDTAPVFAARFRECDCAIGEFTDWSVEDVLRQRPGAPALSRVEIVQPALFAVHVALAALWQARGLAVRATQTGARAALVSVGAILAGGIAVIADPIFRRELSALEIITVLGMLSLLCLCSYTVSRVQQRRLISVAELTASRSLLLADVMTAEERERGRIAEALHDGALQTLLVARQDLRDVLRGKDPAGVSRASELVTGVSEELRQVTRELHPAVLHEAGLGAAVRTLAQAFTERSGVPVDLVVDYPFAHPDDAMLYGVARELLNNVARHAEASRVWLDLRDEGDDVTLQVRDDGIGMTPGALSQRLAEGHIGLASHRARIETIGGRIDFPSSEPGTTVRVRIPARYDNPRET